MTSLAILQKLQSQAALADGLLSQLRIQLESVRKSAVEKACLIEEERLRKENEGLRKEVEALKQRLIRAEINNGIQQVPLPTSAKSSHVVQPVTIPMAQVEKKTSQPPKATVGKSTAAEKGGKQDNVSKTETKKENKPEKKVESKPAVADGGDRMDVSRLNMRIGKIIDVKKHPDADSLYVEEVDVGEPKTRTIVSGLVQHVPLEKMQDRVAVFLLNLKPAKMRGILSEGMIMCGSSPEKVEIIEPPEGVSIGERVVVDGYPGASDEQLNPKKKIWEQIQPDLKINGEGVATYRGVPWNIRNLGSFKVPTMTNSGIK